MHFLFKLLKEYYIYIYIKKKKPNTSQLPPVHHHQSSQAAFTRDQNQSSPVALTRDLCRHQRRYPLPTGPHNRLLVFFKSLTDIRYLFVSFKCHTRFSKSKDQTPTNVYIRSQPEKWPITFLPTQKTIKSQTSRETHFTFLSLYLFTVREPFMSWLYLKSNISQVFENRNL